MGDIIIWLNRSIKQMSSSSFPDQVKNSLIPICQLFTSCIQHYALHCNTDGHFSQLIFGADLARVHRSINSPAAISQLLINHLVSFEEQLGTNVKILTFFIRDLFLDRFLNEMNRNERRLFLKNIYTKLYSFKYISIDKNIITKKEEINIELLIEHILDTLPRRIFDRKGIYHELLSRLIKRMY
jgi:hypothetical protein